MYPDQIVRYERVRAITEAKLRERRAALEGLDHELLVDRLTREALDEAYDDVARANYEWDAVERIVRRVVEAEGRGP